jgi:hypothetical protein
MTAPSPFPSGYWRVFALLVTCGLIVLLGAIWLLVETGGCFGVW